MSVPLRRGLGLCIGLLLLGCDSYGHRSAGLTAQIDTLPDGSVRITDSDERIVPIWEASEVFSATISADDSLGFGEAWDLAVDSRGRVFALLTRRSQVRVYEPDGRIVRVVGRPGGVFDREERWLDGGLHQVVPRGFHNRWQLIGSDGQPTATVLVPMQPDGRTVALLSPVRPFEPSVIHAPDVAEGIWVAYTTEYRLVHLNWASDTMAVTTLAVQPAPLSRAERTAALEGLRENARQTAMAKPAHLMCSIPRACASGCFVCRALSQ